MKPWRSLILGLFIAKAIAFPSQAQIVPDGTTNTVTNSTDNGTTIEAGDRAGNNLFHSFQEFSVPNASEAFFNNANDIVNIFSRVTGGDISNIDGLLKANGDANLFLINPAGIVFGEGAALDLGGSFVTSTAESIIFTDNVEFSATDRDNPPLLTINQPLGLNFGNKIGDIAINGSNLQVNNGRTLALFGGNITLTEGQIIAPGANIELGGLTQPGQISFEQLGDEINFNSINFPEGIARGDITLVNGAEVDVRAAGGGSINVQARNLELSGGELGGSNIRAGITSESNSTTARVGNINLNATENVSLSQRSSILNVVEESGVGNAGEININTTNLSLVEESKIDTSTFGRGNGGAIAIDAAETISIDGEVAVKNSSLLADGKINSATFGNIVSVVQSTATGNSGEIEINTANLSLTRGGVITGGNFDGWGDAGKITINATDTISLDGENQDLTGSGITNIVGTTKASNSNDIEITTSNLFLKRGVIGTSNIQGGDAGDIRIKASNTITVEGAGGIYTTAGEGAGTAEIEEVNAGEIEIVTKNLNLIKGGTISAGIFGVGNAGTITIRATDTISIDGSTRAVTSPNNPDGNLFISGIYSIIGNSATGNEADIRINTDRLSLSNDAIITAESLGNGNGGNILIQANSLDLNNRASLNASTSVGQGGNINLQVADNLTLQNNSTISAQALEDANSGNINIDAEFVVAFPNQNNDIIAAADRGVGGNINITTSSLFGFTQSNSTPANNTNDIDAASELGLDGTVAINELEVNPAEGLEELPTEVIDVTRLIAQSLCQQGDVSEFIVTGKGGIAPSPNQPREWEMSEVDLVEPASYIAEGAEEAEEAEGTEEEIVEAQGWIINDRGIVELVAHKTSLNGSLPQPEDGKICSK